MAPYILSMSCVSGDSVQVAIHRKEDIVRWLETLDHEGSSWSVVLVRFLHHEMDGDVVMGTTDITDEIMAEYGRR